MHKVDRNKVDDHGYLTVVGPNFETPSNIVKKIIENFDTVVSQVTDRRVVKSHSSARVQKGDWA